MKTIANIPVTRVDAECRIRLGDQSGDTAVYRATSDQGVDLAAMLNDLLADEDEGGAAG
jgi:hypothetical protein